jgi:hypothetical protein
MTAPTLIEQLRDAAATGRSLIHADVLMERAADALAAGANILAARDAELARLREAKDAAVRLWNETGRDLQERDAELARLRNALAELVECERTDGMADGPSYTHWVNAWKRGRAALAQPLEKK